MLCFCICSKFVVRCLWHLWCSLQNHVDQIMPPVCFLSVIFPTLTFCSQFIDQQHLWSNCGALHWKFLGFCAGAKTPLMESASGVNCSNQLSHWWHSRCLMEPCASKAQSKTAPKKKPKWNQNGTNVRHFVSIGCVNWLWSLAAWEGCWLLRTGPVWSLWASCPTVRGQFSNCRSC